MKRSVKNLFAFCLLAVFFFASSGCGTILYPERIGQEKGRVDPGVAVLDGLGLFLFIVPGVVGFAVDFSNGTIYLPETSEEDSEREEGEEKEEGNDRVKSAFRSNDLKGSFRTIRTESNTLTRKQIEYLIWRKTGKRVNLQEAIVKKEQLTESERVSEEN